MFSLLFLLDINYLVFANDHISESSTLPKQEHGVRRSALCLASTSTITTVISVPFTIIRLAGRDLDNLAVGLGADSGRNTSSMSVTCKGSMKESRDGSDDSSNSHGGNDLG
jgi:hypothetical protein